MKELTIRQQEILAYLQKHFSENGYWPSIRDIQAEFGFKSTNAVMGHLKALEQKEVISRVPGQARAYHTCQAIESFPTQILNIPIYGSIAAGYPDRVESSNAIGNIQIDVSTSGVRNRSEAFALKVRGESMIDAGIHDGDIVIVEKGDPAHRDIVAALIDGETTLKRYIKEPGITPYLKAENGKFPDLMPLSELIIEGIARSIVRCL